MPKARRRCSRVGCREFVPCGTHGAVKWYLSNSQPLPRNWGALVREVKKRDSCVCRYCRVYCPRDGQVDHIIPRAEGGTDDLSNLQWLCTSCHSVKTKAESKRGQQR